MCCNVDIDSVMQMTNILTRTHFNAILDVTPKTKIEKKKKPERKKNREQPTNYSCVTCHTVGQYVIARVKQFCSTSQLEQIATNAAEEEKKLKRKYEYRRIEEEKNAIGCANHIQTEFNLSYENVCL